MYALLLFLDLIEYYKKDLGVYTLGGLDAYVSDEAKSMVENTKTIQVNVKDMSATIFGKDVDGFAIEAVKILKGLGFAVAQDGDILRVDVPLWRGPSDLNIAEDIMEEVARIYGYDRIEVLPMSSEISNVPFTPFVDFQRKVETFLVRNAKFDQMETYPWVDNKLLDIFGVDKKSLYSLQNPTITDAPCLRNSMRENLVSYVAKNSKFFDEIRVFDIAKVWNKDVDIDQSDKLDERYARYYVAETMELGAVLYKKGVSDWSNDTSIEAKTILSSLLDDQELTGELEFRATDDVNYHPKKQAEVYYDGIKVGFVGALHPLINKAFKMPETASVTYFALYAEPVVALLEGQKSSKGYSFETLQDQILWRDLCFVVDVKDHFADLISAVK